MTLTQYPGLDDTQSRRVDTVFSEIKKAFGEHPARIFAGPTFTYTLPNDVA